MCQHQKSGAGVGGPSGAQEFQLRGAQGVGTSSLGCVQTPALGCSLRSWKTRRGGGGAGNAGGRYK